MMKKTLSVIGAAFLAAGLASAMACGSSQKSDTTPPPPPPAEMMGQDAGMGAGAPTGTAATGNPCGTGGAAASGNPCTKK